MVHARWLIRITGCQGQNSSVRTTETLTQLLCDRASTQPDQVAYTFLRDGEAEAGSLTYAVLDRRARAVAAELMGRIDKGERAMLLFPTGLDFLVAFFGCLYAGVIAVPAPPPDPARVKRTMPDWRRSCPMRPCRWSSPRPRWRRRSNRMRPAGT